MDSFSSFTEAAVGEVSTLTSLISLLAVAKTIANHSSDFEAVAERNGRAIIFAFFHGVCSWIRNRRCLQYHLLN